ncbi:hypothetical protein FZO89_01245 [Luteimonas viscosa]|uniref:Peptidase inhibitor I78 family protein n=1 Tax=Luteimonas viscosa TaxID=1132694 RepID=A0A5D4XTV6_9GAMM|nr:hypothetical protein FZO89_01245 [Luteimonas viscosa]
MIPKPAPASAIPTLPALAAGVLLAGCMSTPGPSVGGSGACRDSGLGWAAGQPADEANMRRLARESGAGLVDPIGPDSRPLADRRGDRLRVRIDAGNIIESARCE